MKAKKPKTKTVPIRLTEDTVNQAKEIARAELSPYSAVLRRAIVEWLENYQKGGIDVRTNARRKKENL